MDALNGISGYDVFIYLILSSIFLYCLFRAYIRLSDPFWTSQPMRQANSVANWLTMNWFLHKTTATSYHFFRSATNKDDMKKARKSRYYQPMIFKTVKDYDEIMSSSTLSSSSSSLKNRHSTKLTSLDQMEKRLVGCGAPYYVTYHKNARKFDMIDTLVISKPISVTVVDDKKSSILQTYLVEGCWVDENVASAGSVYKNCGTALYTNIMMQQQQPQQQISSVIQMEGQDAILSNIKPLLSYKVSRWGLLPDIVYGESLNEQYKIVEIHNHNIHHLMEFFEERSLLTGSRSGRPQISMHISWTNLLSMFISDIYHGYLVIHANRVCACYIYEGVTCEQQDTTTTPSPTTLSELRCIYAQTSNEDDDLITLSDFYQGFLQSWNETLKKYTQTLKIRCLNPNILSTHNLGDISSKLMRTAEFQSMWILREEIPAAIYLYNFEINLPDTDLENSDNYSVIF